MKHVAWRIFGALAISLTASLALAQPAFRESFESADRTWELGESDCTARIVRHERLFDESHTGSGSEHLEYRSGHGTKVYLTHAVSPARIIDELAPSLWVKSTRPGIQLAARVVYPRTRHPQSGEPFTALLMGSVYSAVGSWQQLRIADLRRQAMEQVIVLRRAYPSENLDAGEAYIDLLVLNAYTGRGATQLWIDDLELIGFALAEPAARSLSPGAGRRSPAGVFADSGSGSQALEIEVRGSLLHVAGRPFFARVVEHNGEPLATLKELGFNTVKLRHTPTRLQTEEAARLQLWLLAPPPSDLSSDAHHQVLGWLLGERLAAEDLDAVRRRAGEIHRQSAAARRPLLADVIRAGDRYAQLADVLVFGQDLVGTSFQLADYGPWLQDRQRATRGRGPWWASIQTEPTPAQRAQLAALDGRHALPQTVEPEQIWLQAYQAIAAGARGLWFRSSSPLDGQDAATRLRAAALARLNSELAIIEPWAAGGSPAAAVSSTDPRIRVPVLRTESARLLLVMRTAADQQFSIGPFEEDVSVSLAMHGTPINDRPYRAGAEGLQPLPRATDPDALLELDAAPLVTPVVLTQDPLVVNHLGRTVAQERGRLARLLVEIGLLQLEETDRVARRLKDQGQGLPGMDARIQAAERFLGRGQQLLHAGDTAQAQQLASRALDQLRRVRWAYWYQASLGLPAPVSSPFCSSYAALPGHWDLMLRLQEMGGRLAVLAADDFESPQRLREGRWAMRRGADPRIGSAAELVSDAARSGRMSLELRAWTEDAAVAATPTESWPLSITSPPLAVRQGDLLRIHGWVNVPRPIEGSRDGLLIFDSLSGLEWADRVHQTAGWREFTLYRAAPRSGAWSLTFALSGLGEVLLDEVSVALVPSSARIVSDTSPSPGPR